MIRVHRWTSGKLRALPFVGLLATGLAVSAAAPVAAQSSGTWTKTGSMTTPREDQTATLLQNGQVLVVGGGTSTGPGAELYNPAMGKWTATGSTSCCGGGTVTLLQNGQVLLAGGYGAAGAVTSSAELYNPATGTWTATGSMHTARFGHTATLLPNGQVLVAGGNGDCVNGSCPIFSSAELYNPATGAWTPTGSMSTGRDLHTATLLPNGQVLVAGGGDGVGIGSLNSLASAQLYNPATGTWTTTGSLNISRYGHLAALLGNGQVLVMCGDTTDPSFAFTQSSAELYNPATGTWTLDGNASSAGTLSQQGFNATLLNTGQVLFSGGTLGVYPAKIHVLANATLFDPATGTSTSTGSMTIPRRFDTLTLLPNGQVLAAGGQTQNNVGKFSITDSAELYTP